MPSPASATCSTLNAPSAVNTRSTGVWCKTAIVRAYRDICITPREAVRTRAASEPAVNEGPITSAITPMITITTSSSTSVKPPEPRPALSRKKFISS